VGLKRQARAPAVTAARIGAITIAFLAVCSPAHAADAELVPIRMAGNISGGQGEVPYVVQKFGLDRKHGLVLDEVALSAPSMSAAGRQRRETCP
jgi:hypothetical protein